jgi:LmbE family N-acetylglucosaminyl deacetylase
MVSKLGGKMNILVVAAHADDEVLGTGATLVKHQMHGDTIHLLYMTDTITSRGEYTKDLKKARDKVARYLGASCTVAVFPDQKLDIVPQLSLNKVIESEIEKVHPDLIYTHTDADANIDHVAVFKSVRASAMGIPIRMFEIMNPRWPPRRFNPTHYEDVKEYMRDKLRLLSFYRSELRPYPHPRSIGGIMVLARYRGLERMMKYAEAFEEVK